MREIKCVGVLQVMASMLTLVLVTTINRKSPWNDVMIPWHRVDCPAPNLVQCHLCPNSPLSVRLFHVV